MKTKLLTNNKFWGYSVIVLVLLYAIIWGIGYYRVQLLVNNLRSENKIKGDRIEYCFESVTEGDSVKALDSILDVGHTLIDGEISKYYFYYDSMVEETSSVSNRLSKGYKVEVLKGRVYSIKSNGAMTHGDSFINHWKFYPMVCFCGLKTYEDK